MSFLQPALLMALPLVALPIIIHLINQRRYQTVRWGAMMFLLAANRMSRGYARLRQYLIMAFRMAALAGLIFAVSRPLAGGLLGLTAGGRADTTIVILDRSPSMSQGATGAGGTKLETGFRQIVETLKTLGSNRWILIDSATSPPRELASAQALAGTPGTGPVSASADIPGMLQSALDYMRSNKTGRTEIWLCSDIRENDWNAEGGRWTSLREAFLALTQGVRFHLLAYPESAPENLSVRVTEVRRQKVGEAAELLISLKIAREGGSNTGKISLPVQFVIDGARSELTIEMTGDSAELKGYRISLERGHEKGWGKVTIPADANLADNEFWFAFSEPAPRKIAIVAEDTQVIRSLQLVAEVSPDFSLISTVEVVLAEQVTGIDWESLSLLLWQAPLPEGDRAKLVEAFVERGGVLIAFPSESGGDAKLLNTGWGRSVETPQDVAVETWRGDQDLLANTQSGASLPVGELQVRKYRELEGEFTALASLKANTPFLARVTTTRGGAYFCTTTPSPNDSTLASNGVVLYVMIQRALAAGAEALGATRQLVAGEASGEASAHWQRVAGAEDAISTDYLLYSGVYASGDRLLAINRPLTEDTSGILTNERVAGLFRGLDFARVDEQAGSLGSLVQEVWRLFLGAMMIALVVEAALCLPKPGRLTTGGAIA